MESALVLESILLAAVALRWLLARRVVNVVHEVDYVDGKPRTFIKAAVRFDPAAQMAYLADARTGRALQFVGMEAGSVQMQLGPEKANIALYLKGVPITQEEQAPCAN